MPSTFILAPSPKWYFLDSQGRPAAGGTITTRSSLDHTTPKFVFSDAAGLFPYTDPIVLDGTGGSPVPMYFELNGVDLYYVEVRDASGNIICVIDNFPITGGGGSTPVTANVDIENHLINGQFLFIDATDEAESLLSPVPAGNTHLAPGSGFFKNTSGQYIRDLNANVPAGWSFVKSGGAGATDSIQFVKVTAIGEGFPNAPSANATRYFRYELTGIGAPVTDASLICVIPNVELFSNELLTISFDSFSNVAAVGGVFRITQFYGTGGAPSISTSISQAFTFANNIWARQSLTITPPSVVGKSKGTNQDDCLIIEWIFPLNTIGRFEVANLQVQRGNFALPPYIEQTYAQDQYKVLIDLINTGDAFYRTGDYLWSDNGSFSLPTERPGWVLLFNNAQTLGSTASTATHKGFGFKNLYLLWWTIYPQTECIVAGGRGATALADFNANKDMTIPQHVVNYVFAVAGNAIPFGFFEGERTHTLTIPEIPSHVHGINFADSGVGTSTGSSNPGVTGTTTTDPTGGGLPHNNMQPTTYKYLYVKL